MKSAKIHKLSRHEERPEDEQPTVYVLLHHLDLVQAPFGLTLIHGAYSTEAKVLAELKRLSKDPRNRLTKKQRTQKLRDPMDSYSIREVVVL